MRCFILLSLLAISLPWAASCQSRSEVAIGFEEAGQHIMEPQHTWVRVPKASLRARNLRLTLTISPQGDVLHAEAQGNSEERDAWPAAQAVVYGWKFRPFLRDGRPVTAVLISGISLVPPEDPPNAVAEPALRPTSHMEISLERTACFGSCPAYTVTLTSQGVAYQGDRFNAINGAHYAPLAPGALQALAQRMLDARWFGMKDEYRANWTDNPTQTVTLTVDGQSKKVIDYVGIEAGMPDAVRDLEYEIDRVAGSGRWVRGESGLASLLQAEGFDFKSATAQAALRTAARNGDAASVREFLAAGAPRERLTGQIASAKQNAGQTEFNGLLTAAAHQPDVLRVLEDAGVGAKDDADKNLALTSAVTAGNAEAVRLLLDYGADPHADLEPLRQQAGPAAFWLHDSPSLLVNAVRSGDPETLQVVLSHLPLKESTPPVRRASLVELAASGNSDQSVRRAECARLLLQAGADIHGTDDRGRTALHVAVGAPLVNELLRAGADVNAQDNEGDTPAFSTYDPAVFRLLAAHGANLGIRNHAGQTPMQNPQRFAPEWEPIYAEVRAAQAGR